LSLHLNFTAHTPSEWKNLPNSFCAGSKQSPVDIVTKNVTTDPNLGNFNLTGFNSQDVFTSIMNNGHTEPWVNFTSYLSNLTDKGWSFFNK
uniref:Alpha-carbonic anhydrase domain-containing protein n=1 Tax=Oreochromis aureus TaxID=47969 RepID=A0A668TH95_OREAU